MHTSFPPLPQVTTYTLPTDGYLTPPEQDTPSPFDPEPIAALLEAQWPTLPAVAAALRSCTSHWVIDKHSTYLLDPASEEAQLPIKAVLTLRCPRYGRIVIDVLVTDSILELYFLDEELPVHMRNTIPEEPVYVPPFTVVHRSWD